MAETFIHPTGGQWSGDVRRAAKATLDELDAAKDERDDCADCEDGEAMERKRKAAVFAEMKAIEREKAAIMERHAKEQEVMRIDRGFLPESVRVGPFTYSVRIEDGPFMGDDHAVLSGEANHNEGMIRVMRASPDQMFVTLWHEVLHAIDNMAGTELTEDTVNRLAPILVGVLRDNVAMRGG